MLSSVFAAPRITQVSSTIVVAALHSTGDGGPVNFTMVNLDTGTDEEVGAAGAVDVVVAAMLVLVVVLSVVVVDVFVALLLLLLQAASINTERIPRQRIRTLYVVL
jgi:hypothetical protein